MVAVYVNLKKAFENICCELLIRKLIVIDVGITVLKLCKIYLITRKSKCENCFSNETKNSIGVPQGTELNPFVFIRYEYINQFNVLQ